MKNSRLIKIAAIALISMVSFPAYTSGNCKEENIPSIHRGEVQLKVMDWKSQCSFDSNCDFRGPAALFELKVVAEDHRDYEMASMILIPEQFHGEPEYFGDFFFRDARGEGSHLHFWIGENKLKNHDMEMEIWKAYDHEEAEVVKFKFMGKSLIELLEARKACLK